MPLKPFLYILTLAATLLFAAACRRGTSDNPELLHAAYILDNEPDSIKEAVRILKNISQNNLNQGDKSLHTLLSVKADDKLYIPHTSDSLILSSLKYEEKHQNRGYYPEALHYAGRVYSDLGDYPTATNYHEKSLEAIPLDKKYDQLRFRVLYSLAWSLTAQCLYSSADSVAQQAIRVAENMNDRYQQAISYELIGSSQLNRRLYTQALSSLGNAERIYKETSSPDTITTIIQIAYIQAKQGLVNEAFQNIKRIEPLIDSVSLPLYLPMAAEIFLKAGYYREAREAAQRLLELKDFSNRCSAYSILLNPDIENFIEPDSCVLLSREYARELALHYERRDSMQSLHQLSLYNYDLHDRNRIKAENKMMKWKSGVVIAIIVLLIVTIVFLIRERNKSRRIILLQKDILDLTERLSQAEIANNKIDETIPTEENNTPQENPDSSENKGKILLSRLMPIINGEEPNPQLEIQLASSDILKKFRNSILQNEIPTDDWLVLEKEVLKQSPHFRENLRLLSNNSLEDAEYRIALLIRCHFRPSEIGYILDIKPGTVSRHRGNISKKIFKRNIGTRLIDRVIKSL